MLITAIDKAINKGHYAAEDEKERQFQLEQSEQFNKMLEQQMASSSEASKAIFGQVENQREKTDELYAFLVGGSSAGSQSYNPMTMQGSDAPIMLNGSTSRELPVTGASSMPASTDGITSMIGSQVQQYTGTPEASSTVLGATSDSVYQGVAASSMTSSAPSPSELNSEAGDLKAKIQSKVANGTLTQSEADALTSSLDADLKAAGVNTDTVKVEQGRVWGDPHFVGADGEKYDVQGEAGKTYNILSDQGLQVNARFDQFGDSSSGETVMGEVGITLGKDQVQFSKDGVLKINGEEVKDGTYLDGAVTLKEGKLSIKEDEFSFDVEAKQNEKSNYLNIERITSANANADGVLPSGLWGTTVDGDGKARTGDTGSGAQGGGAIEDAEGNITAQSDKDTVKSYEVNDLFDTNFNDHNQFNDKAEERQELGEKIDRVGKQLEELDGINTKANEILSEIDDRVANGQISESDASSIRDYVTYVVDQGKKAVIDTDDSNEILGNNYNDNTLLSGISSILDNIDKALNEFSSVKLTGSPIDRLEQINSSVGEVANTFSNNPIQEIVSASNEAARNKMLEWV
jgi:hypothetical protein